MSTRVAVTTYQIRVDVAGDVAQLYMRGKSHAEIGKALNLTEAQVDKTLSDVFAEGMPKRERRRTSDEKVRAIHAAYVRGDGSLSKLARAIGLTPSGARRRMSDMNLPVRRHRSSHKPARSSAHAEQRVITALLMARVDELRTPRALSLEGLARASGISLWTLDNLRNEFSDPRLTTVLRLCHGLGVSAGELLGDLPMPIEARTRRPRTPDDPPQTSDRGVARRPEDPR